jgi:hypothetical protein
MPFQTPDALLCFSNWMRALGGIVAKLRFELFTPAPPNELHKSGHRQLCIHHCYCPFQFKEPTISNLSEGHRQMWHIVHYRDRASSWLFQCFTMPFQGVPDRQKTIAAAQSRSVKEPLPRNRSRLLRPRSRPAELNTVSWNSKSA